MLVFAFKGGRRPTEETELFHAPYPNVYESGSLCTGNAAVPSSNEANPEPWIRMFFESRFTHYHNGLHVKYRGGNDAFFKAWWEGGWKTFPEKHLRPFGKTLGELISKGRAA
jgi:PRTRC genetic system protein B